MTQYDLGKVVGSDGQQGAKGDDGNGIASIVKTSTSGKVDTYTITYTDGDTDTFTVTNGNDGAKGDTGATGNGISSVTKTGSSGLVDTYTIAFTNGTSTTFTVTNGSDATVTIVSSWSATTSDNKVPSEKLAKTSLDGKVDKVTGKGLSTNDFTNSYKSTIDGLSSVATSGSYNDLSNKPSIPSSSSDLSDGSDLIKKSSTSGLVKNDGSIDTNTYLTSSAITGMLTTSDIANNLTTTTTGKVLDATQGKALADLIGNAITYINQ